MLTIKLIELYFYVCEIYAEELKAHCFRHTKNQAVPAFTDEELLTTYLFSVAYDKKLGVKDIYMHIYNYWLSYFPDLPSYQAYNRRLNQLTSVFPVLIEHLLQKYTTDTQARQLIALTDSMPIITCSGSRKGKVASHLCDKGYNATKKMYFYGVKLHGIGLYTPKQLPMMNRLQIGPASEHDLEAQRELLKLMADRVVFADKAFCDGELQAYFKERGGELVAPIKYKRGQLESDKQRHRAADELYSKAISRIRQPIESFFNWLIEHTDIQRASKVRSFNGLLVHVFGKIAAVLVKRLAI